MNDNVMFSIYRIVHFATGLCYVGKSNNPYRRRIDHYSHLKHNTHKNTHLQRAWNKYGRDAFYFEVLEKNILKTDIDERERFWIRYFDSYKTGFNKTVGGDGTGGKTTPCEWNGIKYNSITEAAQALGIDFRAMQRRFQRGCFCDADMHGSKKGCMWNGVHYETVKEAAIANGVTLHAMKGRIFKGWTCDNDFKPYPRKVCIWNGIEYPSICAAARALGIHEDTLRDRIKRGRTGDDTMLKKRDFKRYPIYE